MNMKNDSGVKRSFKKILEEDRYILKMEICTQASGSHNNATESLCQSVTERQTRRHSHFRSKTMYQNQRMMPSSATVVLTDDV